MEWEFKYYDVDLGVNWDVLKQSCEWFAEMEAIPQDHIWHAEGNVQIHTKMVTEALMGLEEFQALSDQDKHIMVTSALMHDIEKRSTTIHNFRDGRQCISAPKHANRGEFTSRTLLYKEFGAPFDIREKVAKLVRYHGIPLWKEDEDLTKTVIESSLYLNNELLCMLSKADVLGRTCNDQENLLKKIEYFRLVAMDEMVYNTPCQFASNLHRFNYLGKNKPMEYIPFDEDKFEVFMMSGVAGSGKDTYIKNNLNHLPMVSLDDIRVEMGVKPTDKKGNGRVYQEAKERCKILMRNHNSFVFNATNTITDTRSRWTRLFETYGGKTNIVYVEVPYQTLLTQNKSREDAVPDKIIEKMIKNLEMPTYDEAVDIILA